MACVLLQAVAVSVALWSTAAEARRYSLPMFLPASDSAQQSFARVINLSDETGEVTVIAVDDTGHRSGPIKFTLAPGAAQHFSSSDLERGSEGISGRAGAGRGFWRLELSTSLEIEPLVLFGTADALASPAYGTVTSDQPGLGFFVPPGDGAFGSALRLVNRGPRAAEVTLSGVDDHGERSTGSVRVELRPHASRTVSAEELEAGGPGLTGRIGDGAGSWRIEMAAPPEVLAMNLMASAGGGFMDLSSAPRRAELAIPFFLADADERGHSLLRIRNRSDESATVTVFAVDDSGSRRGPLTLAVNGGHTVHLNSGALEREVGSGDGHWRLDLQADKSIEVSSYVVHSDGLFAEMQSSAHRRGEDHYLPMFNAAASGGQRSLLRLVNRSNAPVQATITGLDDTGTLSAEASIAVAAGAAEMLTADVLEAGGPRLHGGLGTGQGKWRLFVSADGPLTVMGLMEGPNGRLVNLSGLGYPNAATVEVDVFGTGNVVATELPDDALGCATGTCEGTFNAGTRLVLDGQPEAGLNVEWSGCDHVSGSQCEIWLNEDRFVSVAFQSSDPLELADNVIVLSRAQIDGLLEADVERGRLVFDAATTGISAWKAGDLLVSEGAADANDHRAQPFAVRIDSLASTGSRTTVQASQASLEDIFRSGAYRATGESGAFAARRGSAGSRWFSSAAAPSAYRPYVPHTEVAPGVWYVGRSSAFAEAELFGDTLQFRVDAELAPGVHVEGTIDLLVSQEFRAQFPAELRYVARTRTKAKLRATVNASVSYESAKRLGVPVRLPTIRIGHYVFIVPELVLEIPVKATVGAQSFSPSMEMDISANTGFHYLSGEVRLPFESKINGHDFNVGSMSTATATLETGVVGRVSLLLMGIAGPEATFNPFLGVDQCEWADRPSMYGGVRFTVGGRFDLLKKGYRIPIKTSEWSRPLGGVGLSVDDEQFGGVYVDWYIGEAEPDALWFDWRAYSRTDGGPVCGISYDLWTQPTARAARFPDRPDGVKIARGLKRTDYVVSGLTPGVEYCYGLVATLPSSRNSQHVEYACWVTYRTASDRSELAAGERFRDCPDCPEMVVVPPGSFTMGSANWDAVYEDVETPAHGVTIARPFAVGVYEITNDEWIAACIKGRMSSVSYDFTRRIDADDQLDKRSAEQDCFNVAEDVSSGGGHHPMIGAYSLYLSWLSEQTGAYYRLLSEAEWEYAARAGSRTPYHTGRFISTRQANFGQVKGDGGTTRPVGSYRPNAFGLYDMHGNAAEIVEDCWHSGYEGAPIDGRAWTWDCENRRCYERDEEGDWVYICEDRRNPDCNAYSQGRRVSRGGSFHSCVADIRSSARAPFGGDWWATGGLDDNVGLRVARALAGDHGDSYDSATEITVPSRTVGVSEHVHDVDYFRFVVPPGREVRMTVRGTFGDNVNELDYPLYVIGKHEHHGGTGCYRDPDPQPDATIEVGDETFEGPGRDYVCPPGTHTVGVTNVAASEGFRSRTSFNHTREYVFELELR